MRKMKSRIFVLGLRVPYVSLNEPSEPSQSKVKRGEEKRNETKGVRETKQVVQ
jgi:hypothetical protein